jgi:hypothetical protein
MLEVIGHTEQIISGNIIKLGKSGDIQIICLIIFIAFDTSKRGKGDACGIGDIL